MLVVSATIHKIREKVRSASPVTPALKYILYPLVLTNLNRRTGWLDK